MQTIIDDYEVLMRCILTSSANQYAFSAEELQSFVISTINAVIRQKCTHVGGTGQKEGRWIDGEYSGRSQAIITER
jgi:hypothetical protein